MYSSHQHCCLCTTSNFTYKIQMRESTVTELNIPRTLTFFPSNPKRPQGNICNPGLLQYSQAWLDQQDPFLGFKLLTLKVHRIGFPQELQEAGGMGMGSSINGDRYLNTCVSCCLWNVAQIFRSKCWWHTVSVYFSHWFLFTVPPCPEILRNKQQRVKPKTHLGSQKQISHNWRSITKLGSRVSTCQYSSATLY